MVKWMRLTFSQYHNVPIVSVHMDHTYILKLKGCDSDQQLVRFPSFFKSTLREKLVAVQNI